MNILEIARACGIKTNNPITGTECIEAFAAAVIEEYKASLVPVAYVDKNSAGKISFKSYYADYFDMSNFVGISLYALPKETP